MKYFILLLIFVTATVTAQESSRSNSCDEIMAERMIFLTDGSFVDEASLVNNLYVLTACGLDDYDIKFFGNMNYMSGMLKNLTKNDVIERITYGDLMQKIKPIITSEKYRKVKATTLRSEELGELIGNEQTWPQDKLIFQELGASQRIIDAVGDYLKEYPNNQKSYREILQFISEQ